MATDMFGLEEEKLKETSRRRLRFVLVSVFAAAIFGFGAYGFVYGFDAPKNFLSQTAALALQAFRDVADFRSSGRLAAEIDLGGGPQSSAPVPVVSETVPSGVGGDYAGAEIVSSPQVSSDEGSMAPSSASGKLLSTPSPDGAVTQPPSAESAKTTSASAAAICDFTGGTAPSREVVFNEVAWMGSVPQIGETATQAANNEWIELKNVSRDDIDLTGWQILDVSEKFKIAFGTGEKLSAGGFYLLERTDDDSVPGIKANKIYSGALANSGMDLRLFGADCALADEINASSGWPGGDNATKATMERNIGDFGWYTSTVLGGTPKAENSTPLPASTTTTATTTATTTVVTDQAVTTTADIYYTVSVSFQGDGGGTVTSSPPGIFCGVDCTESYKKGTLLALTATPDSNSSFIGWSGACSSTSLTTGNGTNTCSFTVTGTAAVVGMFKSVLPPPSYTAPPPPESSSTPQHVLISEIMAGIDDNPDYEFIELYNPTSNQIDLTGWSMKKKNSNGTVYPLLVASRLEGKSIGPNGYFLAARDAGYNGAVMPDVWWPASSSYLLGYTNYAVILYDVSGNEVEEVDWTSIPAGKSYARVSWDSSDFVVQDVPTPQNSAMH